MDLAKPSLGQPVQAVWPKGIHVFYILCYFISLRSYGGQNRKVCRLFMAMLWLAASSKKKKKNERKKKILR